MKQSHIARPSGWVWGERGRLDDSFKDIDRESDQEPEREDDGEIQYGGIQIGGSGLRRPSTRDPIYPGYMQWRTALKRALANMRGANKPERNPQLVRRTGPKKDERSDPLPDPPRPPKELDELKAALKQLALTDKRTFEIFYQLDGQNGTGFMDAAGTAVKLSSTETIVRGSIKSIWAKLPRLGFAHNETWLLQVLGKT